MTRIPDIAPRPRSRRWRLGRAGPRLLRLLRGQGRHETLQQGIPGGARAGRRPHGRHDVQRLQGRPQGVRDGRAGAHGHRARADQRRRQGAGGPPGRLHRAAACRVLRREPVRWSGSDSACASRPPRRPSPSRAADAARARSLGVTIEARYTVGEYDILILSATESRGLETWLRSSGYRIPAGASDVLTSYIRQNMRFFVAKVNLAEQAKLGFSTLRPIQVAYDSPKFMLPVRLGTVNADGTAGDVRLHADPEGPRGDHQLPHGEAAHRRGDSRPS